MEKAFTVSGSEGGFMELMTHPGYADGELQRLSLYVEERERELLTLCDPDTRKLLESRGFILARNRSDCERGPSVRAGALEK